METDTLKGTQQVLVWGYIREIEKRFEFDNVPQDVIDLINLFNEYCDEWSKKYTQKDCIILVLKLEINSHNT